MTRHGQCVHAAGRREAGTPDTNEEGRMRGLLRALLAGWGAKKLGGGCISTIVIFLILWWLLRGLGL